MKIIAIMAAPVAALLVLAGPSAGHPDGAKACKPGYAKIRNQRVYVYCGPAKATVKIAGKTYAISGGRCKKISGPWYAVDVGIQSLGRKVVSKYLLLRNPKLTDGTTRNVAIVNVQAAGDGFSLGQVVVKISGGGTRGTFSGDALGPTGRVTGSWTC